jgi:hypothetical protein
MRATSQADGRVFSAGTGAAAAAASAASTTATVVAPVQPSQQKPQTQQMELEAMLEQPSTGAAGSSTSAGPYVPTERGEAAEAPSAALAWEKVPDGSNESYEWGENQVS